MFTLMVDSEQTRRDGLMLPAVNPADGTMYQVQISFSRMQVVARRSLGHAKECGIIVPVVLKEPLAIFEGFCRDEDEDKRGYSWRCYCGKPDKSFRVDGLEQLVYPGQIYLVFVNDEKVAYNWRWEKADPVDDGLPEDYKNRFRERVL